MQPPARRQLGIDSHLLDLVQFRNGISGDWIYPSPGEPANAAAAADPLFDPESIGEASAFLATGSCESNRGKQTQKEIIRGPTRVGVSHEIHRLPTRRSLRTGSPTGVRESR